MTPAVLLSLSWFWTQHPAKAEIDKTVTHAAGWRIEKTVDLFTGETACVLKHGDLSVRKGALVMDLGSAADVTNGYFRVDEGPVRKLDEANLDLAATHYPFFGEKQTDPTLGRAALPLTYVAGASSVRVRPMPRVRSQLFKLEGLGEAVAAANQAGCGLAG